MRAFWEIQRDMNAKMRRVHDHEPLLNSLYGKVGEDKVKLIQVQYVDELIMDLQEYKEQLQK